jgi:hypothetical protein
MSKKIKISNSQKDIKNLNENIPTLEKTFNVPLLDKEFWLKSLFILVIVIGIYHAATKYGFVLDDIIAIEENSFTKKGFGGIIDHFTSESMTGYFGEQKNLLPGNRYRPLSLVTFAIEYGFIGKLNPSVSHFINILLYALTCILIFFTFRFIFLTSFVKDKLGSNQADLLAFLTAVIFAVHPLHVEAVANIKGRDEIMCLLFSILSLYYIYKYGLSKNNKELILGCVVFFLALLSKENAITFFLVIPLTLIFFLNKNSGKVWTYLTITTVVYLGWRFAVSGVPSISMQANDLMNNPFLEMRADQKLATIIYTLGYYIKLFLIPHPLTHDYYPYAIGKMNFADWQVILSLAIYGAIIYFGYKLWKKKNITGFAVFYYLVTLSIVTNLVVNLGTFMNDRFVFMPSVGYCMIIALGVIWLANRIKNPKKIMIASLLSLAIIIPYGVKSYTRVPAWKNDLSLNRAAFPASSNSARANTFMGTALYKAAESAQDSKQKLALLLEAYPYVKKAVSITPKYQSGNLMLAGIVAEKYQLNRDLNQFLEDLQIVCLNRPDIQSVDKGDGQLNSFVTDYLSYLNSTVTNDPELIKFYETTPGLMANQKDKSVWQWGIRIGELGLAISPNNTKITVSINKLKTMLGMSTGMVPITN